MRGWKICMDKKEYKIYFTNWLMRTGIVGFLRITWNDGNSANLLDDNGTTLKLNKQTIKSFSCKYSEFISNNKLYGTIKEFYNNSFLAQIWKKSFQDTLKDVNNILQNNLTKTDQDNLKEQENLKEIRKYTK